MKPNVPFVYPNTQTFGDFDVYWENLAWNQYDKWQQNQVSTTALWARWALFAAGMWEDRDLTMWDYSLALRCSRFGTPVAGRGVLRYRTHANSVSSQLMERTQEGSIPHRQYIRRNCSTLGIGCLVGGRLPGLFSKWLEKIAHSVRYATRDCNPERISYGQKPKLFLLLHNKAHAHVQAFMKEASRYSDTFSSVEFAFIDKDMTHNSELERRDNVSSLLAESCATIESTLNTDIVWLIEDDIIVPVQACSELVRELTRGSCPPHAVSGCYYNRHIPNQLLGGWIKDRKHYEPTCHFREREKVDFIGTGCMMYWSGRLGSPTSWKSRTTKHESGATAHDWAWSEAVDGTIVIVGTVDCEHMIDEEHAV
jgi:hypothetical protein